MGAAAEAGGMQLQAGGPGPGGCSGLRELQGQKSIRPLELPRDPFWARDLQNSQVINPACFKLLSLRSFGTEAAGNKLTLWQPECLSVAPRRPPPTTQRQNRLPPAHLPLLHAAGWAPGTRRGYRGWSPSPDLLCCRVSWPFTGLWSPSLLAPFTGGLVLWVGLSWGCPSRCRVSSRPGQPRQVALLQGQGPPEASRHLLHVS